TTLYCWSADLFQHAEKGRYPLALPCDAQSSESPPGRPRTRLPSTPDEPPNGNTARLPSIGASRTQRLPFAPSTGQLHSSRPLQVTINSRQMGRKHRCEERLKVEQKLVDALQAVCSVPFEEKQAARKSKLEGWKFLQEHVKQCGCKALQEQR